MPRYLLELLVIHSIVERSEDPLAGQKRGLLFEHQDLLDHLI